MTPTTDATRRPVPRGIARSGPAILSYGFRPFFLAAGIFALLAMMLWLLALGGAIELGGTFGALYWHAHEMLFGYATAALAGFLLTAIPNWTGRLPVSGPPLMALFGLWLAGRFVMAAPDVVGQAAAAAIDGAFLPVMGLVAAREVIAGSNWKNLKILAAVGALSVANISFHVAVIVGADPTAICRAAVSIYILLIAVVGGRIIPSFTRNFIVKAGGSQLPKPFGRFDIVAIAALAACLLGWILASEAPVVTVLSAIAGILHVLRLMRWQGRQALEEPLLTMLHVAYGFVPLGLFGITAASFGWISSASALHILTVGAIGGMTLAVMTRASLGHTGRPTVASPATAIAYFALLVAAVVRPFAEILSAHYHLLLGVSGAAWLLAFGLFVFEYAPILWSRAGSTKRRVGQAP